MRAIDIHVHPTDERVARAWAGEAEDAQHFFRGPWTTEDLDATAERFSKLDTLAVLLGADAETTTGVGETSTMEVVTHAMAKAVAEFAVPAIVSAVR